MNDLRAEDIEALEAGETILLRKVRRRRHGKQAPFKCSVRRGHMLTGGGHQVMVREVRQDGDVWRIRVEPQESWAVVERERNAMSLEALEAALPGVFVWDEEPDLVVGDIFIFDWHEIRDPNVGGFDKSNNWQEGGDPINVQVPSVYVEITSIVRGKKGEFIAHYRKHGFEVVEYMAPTFGRTSDPNRALAESDGAPAAIISIGDTSRISERDELIREHRRLQQLRSAHQQQLMKVTGPGRTAVLAVSLADVEKKIRALESAGVSVAA